MTCRGAALEHLTQVVTPPSEPRSTDWDAAQGQLGVVLPTDYKELIRTFGGSNWDGYLYLLEPGCSNDNYDSSSGRTSRPRRAGVTRSVYQRSPAGPNRGFCGSSLTDGPVARAPVRHSPSR
jgi:hypothetical protein